MQARDKVGPIIIQGREFFVARELMKGTPRG